MNDVDWLQDAVTDQDGQRWILVGRTKFVWLPITDFHEGGSSVFKRLSKCGVECLTTSSRNSIRKRIEALDFKRDANVAKRPGWIASCYVCADGEVIPADQADNVIVAFDPNPNSCKGLPR